MTPKPIRAGQHQGSSSVLLWTRQLQMAGKLKLTAKSLLNSVKDKQKTSHANITCPGKVVHVVILMPFEPELTRIFLRLSHLSSPSTAFLLLPPSPPPPVITTTTSWGRFHTWPFFAAEPLYLPKYSPPNIAPIYLSGLVYLTQILPAVLILRLEMCETLHY